MKKQFKILHIPTALTYFNSFETIQQAECKLEDLESLLNRYDIYVEQRNPLAQKLYQFLFRLEVPKTKIDSTNRVKTFSVKEYMIIEADDV